MDFIWILFAFVCGLAARFVALPPLVGYLSAGFLLHSLGMHADNTLQVLSDLGITLMLFTIGLKLKLQELLRPEIWVSTLSHVVLWVVLIAAGLLFLGVLGLPMVTGLDLKTCALIAFALCFSSTVCVVKILDESGELRTRQGNLSIAILVLQDIIAVAFLVLAMGAVPSIWAVALVGLIWLRPIIGRLLDKVGHGELLPLLGFFLAVGGYELFHLVDLKGDLGALVFGALLSGNPKATELYKSLMGFKDIFLIGFFLSIGFTALPDLNMLLLAALITLLLPLKSVMFFALFSRMGLRARESFLTALILGNFSEFGLIVMALCVSTGWLSNDWLVILALSVSLSFLCTSMVYRSAHSFYARWKDRILHVALAEGMRPKPARLQTPEIIVIGMGRVGMATYHSLDRMVRNRVWGMDADDDKIRRLQAEGYRAFYGDGEDPELWESFSMDQLELVLIAVPYIQDIRNMCEQLRYAGYKGKIAAIARYEDQIERLEQTGIDKIFNFYNEVGVGFARESIALVDDLETEIRPTAE